MKKFFILLVCSLSLCALKAGAQVPKILGIWEFDPQASTLPQGFPLAQETRSYFQRDDGFVVNVVTRKLSNGTPDFIQVVTKSDGKDYPQYQGAVLAELQINGNASHFSYSETVLDANSVNVIARFDDQVINRGVRTVSEDGQTMTIDVVQINRDGSEVPFQLVFRRFDNE